VTKARESGYLFRLARPFILLVERFYPDPFVFVIALTFVAFAGALFFTEATPQEALVAWGLGLSSLMAFTAQIAITLVTAHASARARTVDTFLNWTAERPRTARQAYAMVASVAGLASLLAWPLGLVVGATLARRVAATGSSRGLLIDYPLLVASAYSGFVVWHMGYSGSAPLFAATPGHALEASIGIIPVSRTILSSWNLGLAALTLAVVGITCAWMAPPESSRRTLESLTTDSLEETRSDAEDGPPLAPGEENTFGHRLSHSRAATLCVGLLVAAYLLSWFSQHGASLNLDIVNWTFLAVGLLLARSPTEYIANVVEGGRSIGSLLVQYPFYAGIMGLLAGTGLIDLFSDAIATRATATSLPVWAFLSGGIVNFFVPSGGGQWAIQGPIFLDAAQQLGVDPALVVMGVAYGDQWTNLIQPFWTIPLLAIAGLRVRDILGYTFVTLITTGIVFAGGLALAARFVP
jgi:short-chain fatty acids transporter